MTEIRQGDQIKQLPNLPDPPSPGTPQYEEKPTTYQDQVSGILKQVKTNLETNSIAPILTSIMGGGAPQGGGDVVNQQLVGMMTTLSGTLTSLIAGEREARQKAEEATSTWQKEYFTSQANNFKEMREKANNPPVAPTTPDKFQEFKQWNDMIADESNKQLAILKAQVPQVHSGPSDVDLELARINHENQRLMMQMQQAHELAMEDIKIKQAQFSLEVAKFKRGEESKTGWLDEVLGVLGMAVQQGSNGGSDMMGAAKTIGGLASQICDKCGTKMTYAPDAGFFSCGKCGAQYTTAEEAVAAAPGTRPQSPREPPPSQYPADTFTEDEERAGGGD